MTIILILAVLTLIILLWLYFGTLRKSNGLPQGPQGLPLVGNIPQMIKNPHLKFSQWAKEYGNLYTIKIGTLDALVVSDAKLIKELFGHSASTGKFTNETILQAARGSHGIIGTDGDQWHEQRSFCMRTLVQHGFGNKTSMELLILSEIQECVDYFKEKSKNSKAVDLVNTLKLVIRNILWTIVTGEKVSLQDQTLSKLATYLFNAIQYSVKTGLMYFSWLKYFAPELSGYNELERAATGIHEFIEKHFETRKKNYTPGAPTNVIDSYLEQMDKQANNPRSSFYGDAGMQNSVTSIVELFIAGGESTPFTITWLVLYICRHPDVQIKLHEEIDRVLGHREPLLKDRINMPYTNAVIQETLRKSSLSYFGLPHKLLEDVEMFGYKLPKGLLIVPNLYHVHHNQETWSDPKNFRPERFLSEDGSTVKSESLIPFQVGKRACLGEPLAKDVLFLFVTKLFQTFQFLSDPDHFTPTMEPDVGVILIPQPFKVSMRVRDHI